MKKFLSILMAFVLLIAISFSGVEKASADNSHTINNEVSQKDLETAKIIAEHLIPDPDTKKLIIINEKKLEKSLDEISSDISLGDLKKDLNNANVIITENAEGYNVSAGLCEIALGAMGLWHGITVDSALYILGIASTPLLIAVTAFTGAIYVGGALLCP